MRVAYVSDDQFAHALPTLTSAAKMAKLSAVSRRAFWNAEPHETFRHAVAKGQSSADRARGRRWSRFPGADGSVEWFSGPGSSHMAPATLQRPLRALSVHSQVLEEIV